MTGTPPAADRIDKHPARIAEMFDAIAGRYDLLNHLLSLGLDRRWRRVAMAASRLQPGEVVLDVCTGTADLAREAASAGAAPSLVVGVDFAAAMLGRARGKLRRHPPPVPVRLARGDAMALPVASASVDVVTAAFGIRNVADVPVAFREMHRVLRPGGRLVVLEFSLPERGWRKGVYLAYFRRVLPLVGRLVSGHPGAYQYLPDSVSAFATPALLTDTLRAAGFRAVEARSLTWGTVMLHVATRSSL